MLLGNEHGLEILQFYDSGDFDPSMKTNYTRVGLGGVRVHSAEIVDLAGRPRNLLVSGLAYRFKYVVEFDTLVRKANFGFVVRNVLGTKFGGGVSEQVRGQGLPEVEASKSLQITWNFVNRFLPDAYFVNCAVYGLLESGEGGLLCRIEDASMFRTLPLNEPTMASGSIDLSPELIVGRSPDYSVFSKQT